MKVRPQTPGFSEPLGHWPDACGFLSPFASSHSVSASFHSLSFESPLVTEAYRQRGPLGMATKKDFFSIFYKLFRTKPSSVR